MRTTALILATAVACAGLAGCKKDAPAAAAAAPARSKPAPFRDNPDFGGVKTVTVETEAIGPTASIAVLRALDMAIAQVNGRRVTSSTQAVAAGIRLDVQGLGSTEVGGDAYVDQVVSASDGVVKGFHVLSQEEVERVDAEYSFTGEATSGGYFGDAIRVSESEKRMSRFWKVRVRADVAKFMGPQDDRPKLVVAAPRVGSERYAVGDAQVDSQAVASEIRARLSDALTQTERFQLLDREFDAEMQDEVDFINSGNARSEEVARLGQRLATDLILVPTIERFAYPRSSRSLRLSGRELTSYSGGGRIALRIINASTGQVVMSESFEHTLPPTAPSTLPRAVDGAGMAATMMDSLSDRMVRAVVNEIFPISVIALQGDQVVLSQGGKSVATGERYDAVVLGEELTDPQTGRSLGRNEIPCCTIRIDRVADKTSYGTIEGPIPASLSAFRPGMVELRGSTSRAAPSLASQAASGPAAGTPPHPAGVADARPAPVRKKVAAAARAEEADENW
ncbi:MAG: CsgG/HfaB family protein [Pseudomonadota bacterium]